MASLAWVEVKDMIHSPLTPFVLQAAQNLGQISDLQAQLEEALKEKQEVQEKVCWPTYRTLRVHCWWGRFHSECWLLLSMNGDK